MRGMTLKLNISSNSNLYSIIISGRNQTIDEEIRSLKSLHADFKKAIIKICITKITENFIKDSLNFQGPRGPMYFFLKNLALFLQNILQKTNIIDWL
jgi:hypothetical protein